MKLHRWNKSLELSFGDHICLLYENKNEYREVAINYILEGISRNEKVVCSLYEYSEDMLIEDLKKLRIDVDNLIKSSQLVIKSVSDVYWTENGFDPVETSNYWDMNRRSFKEEGFTAIRVMGEMIFSVYDERGMDKLIEYEVLANRPYLENEVYLCVCNKNEFPHFVLEEIIQSHNVIIYGMDMIKPNPYHVDNNKQLENYKRKVSIRDRFKLEKTQGISLIDTNNVRKNRDASILKYVLGSTGDGIWEWDVESQEVYINDSFFKILGYKQGQISLKTKHIMALAHPEDLHGFRSQIEKCCQNEIDYIDYEIRVKSKNGEWVWFRIRGTALQKDEISGEALKIVGMYIDIRERKRIKEELDEKNLLEKSNTDFISNISHEIRTPLNVILGSLQLQEFYIKNDQSSEYVSKYKKINKRMKQNSYRLLRLVNNVIDISKIESGFYDINLENYDIKMLTEKIVTSIEYYVKNAGLDVEFRSNIDKLVIACDPEKIEKILLNILSNAIKFTEPGGNIYVDFKANKESATISIKDTGIGIPDDKLEKIFLRFKQVNSLKHRANEGSGIGLSLVKSWVKAHEGEVSVKSKENEGTEFIITLPNKTIISDNYIKNEVAVTKEMNVERLSIEFSDIYS